MISLYFFIVVGKMNERFVILLNDAKDRGFEMWEHKLKNCLLKTAARRLDDLFIVFLL